MPPRTHPSPPGRPSASPPDRRRGATRLATWAALAFAFALGTALAAAGADWPQHLGPERNGTTSQRLALPWPAEGPKREWSVPVGAGFSGPIVAGARVFLHHRLGDEEVLECRDADAGGAPLWRHATPTSYRDRFGFDPGPRATPTFADGRIFTFGADGTLAAVEAETGRRLWLVATRTALNADLGFFGLAGSPLVAGGVVMVGIGGRDGAGIVAFDCASGKVRWKATDHEAGYSSPILTSAGGTTRAVFFTREGLVTLDPVSGRVLGEFRWRSREQASVNAATPLALGHRVLLSASYDTGAVLLDLAGPEPRPVWSGDESLSSHYASLVHHRGQVFGFHGRQETGPSLRCIDADTGKVRWSREGLGAGSVLIAGDHLLVLTERGELLAAPATPEGFRPEGQAQVLGTGVRAYPALARGRWYARDRSNLVCLRP